MSVPSLISASNKKGGRFPPPESALLPALFIAAATATIAAATPAVFLRPSFIHSQRSAIEIVAVERGDGGVAFAIIAHFHERKPSGLPGIAVGYDVHTVNPAIRRKQGSNPIFGSAEAEVSYKYIFHLIFFLEFAEQRIGGQDKTAFCRVMRDLISGLSNYTSTLARIEVCPI